MYVHILSLILAFNPQQEIKENIPAKHETNKTTTKAKSELPTAVAINSPNEQQNTTSDPNKTQNDAHSSTKIIEVVPQADRWFKAYVLFTAAIAFINLGMLLIFRRQRILMSQQLREIIKAGQESERIKKLEYRAWVQPEEANATIDDLGRLAGTVSVQNIGRTPAKKVTAWIMAEKCEHGRVPEFIYNDSNCVKGKPVLHANLPLVLSFAGMNFQYFQSGFCRNGEKSNPSLFAWKDYLRGRF